MIKKFIKKIIKFIKTNQLSVGLSLLFFLSRLPFINPNNVFFDSKEYLLIFNIPNFIQALASGHFPHHEGYILFSWPLYQLGKLIGVNPGFPVVLGQIFLAYVTIFFFYKFIAYISNKKIALTSAILFSLTPLFWVTNVAITLETSYLSCFFASLYLFILYIKKNKKKYLYFSFALLALSIITYSAVILWLTLYLFLLLKLKKEKIKILLTMGVFLGICLSLRILLIALYANEHPFQIFYVSYLSNITDAGHVTSNLEGLLVRIRNFIPVLRSYSSLIVILGFTSLILMYKKDKKLFYLGLLWLLPLLYSNQWWDSLLMGRYSIPAGFGFAFLTAYLIHSHRFVTLLVCLYLCVISLPALSLLRGDTPYMQQEKFAKTLPEGSLLIESHYAQPVLEHCCAARIIAVNDPAVGNALIKKTIDQYLAEKKPVFVSSAALSDPYGLYMGPYLHPLSLSYTNPFELESLLTNYKWEIYKVVNEKDNVIVYKIIDTGKSQYPRVPNLNDHYRRLDYYDPISRIGSVVYNYLKPYLIF
jgi:hypothetical protein